MRKLILILALLTISAPEVWTQMNEPMAAVNKYIAAFNKGDAKGMAAVCANPTSILDGMHPHVWSGPTACEDWYRDVLIEGEQHGAAGYAVTLGKPRHLDVKGEAAYVVLPTTMTFKLKGKQVTQTGATWTVALEKVDGQWRISAWAWAKGGAQ